MRRRSFGSTPARLGVYPTRRGGTVRGQRLQPGSLVATTVAAARGGQRDLAEALPGRAGHDRPSPPRRPRPTRSRIRSRVPCANTPAGGDRLEARRAARWRAAAGCQHGTRAAARFDVEDGHDRSSPQAPTTPPQHGAHEADRHERGLIPNHSTNAEATTAPIPMNTRPCSPARRRPARPRRGHPGDQREPATSIRAFRRHERQQPCAACWGKTPRGDRQAPSRPRRRTTPEPRSRRGASAATRAPPHPPRS